jgi:phosphoglycerol transferase MdoB-like AlkP superfamily enzyme
MLIHALRRLLPRHAQTRYLGMLLASWLVVFGLTRAGLLALNREVADLSGLAVLKVIAVGTVYDLSFLLYAAVVFAAYLLLSPKRWWGARWHLIWLRLFFFACLFAMWFIAVAEYFFWDEFGVRFNFIAVDYLIYSKEVVNNILESYPVFPILAAIGVLSALLTVGAGKLLPPADDLPLLSWRASFVVLAALSVVALSVSFLIGQDSPRGSGGNAYQRELASNGPYQFFAAFRNNEIEYSQFYAGLPQDEVGRLLRDAVAEPNARFVGTDPLDIRRVIDNPGTPKRLNVILVTIESLSAKYLGSFGDTRGLTPNLDKLRGESLFFSKFYATGTRTDRGLEAITLSIPPTPGRSIVKRIGRERGYASLGYQFQQQGYDTAFVYGGRGYFDNMNAFFSGNGYRIVDQASVPESEMQFQNAWGMSDEDLYRQTVQLADADHAAGRPFFLQLMTTSNHRPYTYPDGRIDIPSGDGREGAVKYTDYAIGKFLDEAKKKPWFDQTIFVFVADHNAGSAGKQDLPVDTYHIPLFIHAPAHIQPREVTTLASQIDLAPTLLGLLNVDYTSSFYGRNLLSNPSAPGRALIGNYQHLGLFDGEQLAILSPRRMLRLVADEGDGRRERPGSLDDLLVSRGVAYYQGASYAFGKRLLGPAKWVP